MALECPRCGCEVEQGPAGTPCPKCGAMMRFTLLGDYIKERKQAELAKEKDRVKPPGSTERFGRWLLGFVTVHMIVYLLGGGALFVLGAREMTVAEFHDQQPTLLIAALFGIPIVATFLGVTLSCHQVYLAQLVGFAIGLTANLAVLGERMFLPVKPNWQEWVATPVLGAVVGFLSGYRITGPMYKEEPQDLEKVDDEWKTAANPHIKQLDPGMTVRRQRLIAGAAIGLLFPFIFPPIMGFFLNILTGKPELVRAKMDQFRFGFDLFALFLAGMTAGSGTTRGVRQGVWVGLLLYAVFFFVSGARDWQVGLIKFLPSIFLAVIGGVLGQKVFPPTQIYMGPKAK